MQQERRKDLTEHRDDSTFSFDPTKIAIKQLDKSKIKKIDSRKGMLLSSYSRKKTRRRKQQQRRDSPNFKTEQQDDSVPQGKEMCRTSLYWLLGVLRSRLDHMLGLKNDIFSIRVQEYRSKVFTKSVRKTF